MKATNCDNFLLKSKPSVFVALCAILWLRPTHLKFRSVKVTLD